MDNKLSKEYVDYIMKMCKVTGFDVDREHVENLSFKKYQHIADQLDELSKIQMDNRTLERILAEAKEHGAEYVKEKYGVN